MIQQQSLLAQATQRSCTIQDHDESPIIMRCTSIDCTSPKRWMCVGCIILHETHIKDCLQLKQFAQLIQSNKGRYEFKERKELVQELIQQFHQQKDLILSSLQKLEQLYQSWFKALKQEESTIQEAYTRIYDQHILALTEDDITKILTKTKQEEAFQQTQAKIFSWMKNVNANIKIIGQQLEKFVDDVQHGIVKEEFGEQGFTFVGEYKFGVRYGIWSILNEKGEWIGGGNYNHVGNKVGLWQEIEQMQKIYSFNFYIQYIGKYQDGTKIDQWEIKDKQGNRIGGGQYNKSGRKDGQWIDIQLQDGWYYQHIGKYQDGTKIDQWVIKDNQGNIIGGGQYNKSGRKDGQWIDIESQGYNNYYQHIGKYQDGTKIDQWVIKDNQGNIIGGGQYNKSGRKDGQWIDIESQGYNNYYQHIGKYQDGTKIDQWVIKDNQGNIIGGGQFNNSGRKDGQWIDIESQGYNNYYQHIGKYQDGTKIDQWEIKDKEGNIIGGGQYNKSGRKDGQWIDIEISCQNYYQHIGKYQDGTQIDKWVINQNQGNIIGGGQYNKSGRKDGQWIDIESQGYNNYYQHIGKYQDGTKIDQWEIKDKEGNRIGGGQYNKSGRKDGQWIDIEISCQNYYQHIGKYKDGTKIDQWVIKDNYGNRIGGGQHNKSGRKDGQWIDIEIWGGCYCQHIGNYQDGIKISQWKIQLVEAIK